MIVVIFSVFSLGVGVGMGVVLGRYLLVKNSPKGFRWNNVNYALVLQNTLTALEEQAKPEVKAAPKKRVSRKSKVTPQTTTEA